MSTRLYFGLSNGMTGILLMHNAIDLNGALIDLRLLPLALSALFGGNISIAVTGLMLLIYRFVIDSGDSLDALFSSVITLLGFLVLSFYLSSIHQTARVFLFCYRHGRFPTRTLAIDYEQLPSGCLENDLYSIFHFNDWWSLFVLSFVFTSSAAFCSLFLSILSCFDRSIDAAREPPCHFRKVTTLEKSKDSWESSCLIWITSRM